MNKLTIGMPVYNGASTIGRALDSLLAQTAGEFQIIVSDNLSTDGTQDICEGYARRDPRMRYVRQPRNLGPQMNFRFVLFEARTPFFMWAAADDLWAPTFAARNIAALEGDPSLVMSQSRVLFTEKGVPSHMATGTFALREDARSNAVRFFANPADNSRYYGVFRTEALKRVFPGRPFFALDWLVSAATLRFGGHNELPETLMIRDSSDPSSYARAVLSDHRFILWRIFPLLFMTRWLLAHRSVPLSRDLLRRLWKANLYLHFRFGVLKHRRTAERYLETNSLPLALGLRRRLPVATPEDGPPPQASTAAAPASILPAPGLAALLDASGPDVPLPAGTPRLSIVIVCRTVAAHGTRALAAALRLGAARPVEVVMVVPAWAGFEAKDLAPPGRLTLVAFEGEATGGAMLNAGVAHATADRVLVVAADAWYGPEFLPAIEAALELAPMVAPQVVGPDGRLLAAGGILDVAGGWRPYGEGADPAEPRFAFARACDFGPAAMAFRRDAIAADAPFDATLRDLDAALAEACLRLRDASGPPLYWPGARIFRDATASPQAEIAGDCRRIVHRHALALRHMAWLEAEGRPAHDRSRPRRLLFVDATTPTPDQNAGAIEAISQMKVYGEFGFRVTFIPESNLAHAGRYTTALQEQGIEVMHHPHARSVREVLETAMDGFDVVVLCRAYIAERYTAMVRDVAPRARIVFYTVDLHFLREQREAELGGDATALRAAGHSKARELASVLQADATLVHSTVEQELLARETPRARVHLLPLMRAIPPALEAPGPAGRRDIVFVGTYQHPPNEDAVVFFAREVWPLVRPRLPGTRFLIAGSALTPAVTALAGEGVEVLGFVPELRPLLDAARLSVAPLRFGAGLKGKVATTLEAGLPTIATAIATEGTTLRDGEEVLIADTAAELAEAVVRLATDDELWHRLSAQGFAFARREFSFEANASRLAALLAHIGVTTPESERVLLEADLFSGEEVFRPSKFWTTLAAQHREQLAEHRLVSFKRTVNNCYMQWLPGSFDDPRMERPLAALQRQPSMVPIEIAASVPDQPELAQEVQGYGGFAPFANPDYLRFYAFFTGLVWYLMTLHAGDERYRELEEPDLGRPIRLTHQGRAISQDLAQSLLEYYRIRALASRVPLPQRPTFLELGAGYGRLAYVIKNLRPCRYIIVDIAPTMLVAKWYLPRVMPQAKVFGYRPFRDFEEVREEIEAADLIFLSPNQLALLPDGYADFSISISSLHEMERPQVERYKALLQAKTAHAIYLKQWTRWRNPVDEIETEIADYGLEPPWRLAHQATDLANAEFTEVCWYREA